MCKRLSDETREAILIGLEALAHGASKIEIPTKKETVYLTKLGPKRFQITTIAKEDHKVGPNSLAYRKGMAGGRTEIKIKGSFPRRAEKDRRTENGCRMSGLRDRRAAITGRRTSWKHLPEETFFGKRSSHLPRTP